LGVFAENSELIRTLRSYKSLHSISQL